jgi:dodecin
VPSRESPTAWTIGPDERPAYDACATREIDTSTEPKERDMAKKGSKSGVYRVTEIIGTSPNSWEDAAKVAVETAAESLRDLRVAEVNKLDLKIDDGKVVAFRAKVSLSFKYEA